MEPIEKEQLFIEASLLELKEYLLSPILFWPVSLAHTSRDDRANIPRMTPGNLYLSLRKLQAAGFPAGKRKEITELLADFSAIVSEWRSNWRKKAKEEFSVRIRQWDTYLRELKRDRDSQRASYAYQVRDRVILELLDEQLELARNIETQKIMALDDSVRQITKSGGFVWQSDIIEGFPQEKFWYLYVDIL